MMLRVFLALWIGLFAALPARAVVEVQQVTSPGGVSAWLVESPEIPFVALEIAFRGGTSLDAPGKRGATALMAGLLEEGAGARDARAFARARQALAASFSFDAGPDTLTVSAQMLTENRAEAAALLAEALAAPRFDEDAIERVRAQLIAGLRSDEKDPDTLAAREFARLAFAGHPYGSPGDGTPESVAALTRDDLIAAHKGAIARDRLVVSAVGDITAAELGPLLDALFADLPETGAPLPAPVALALTGGVSVIDFDTPQAAALFGHEGLPRDHPDFFPAFVMMQELGGGGFGSRLMEEVREKRGLTYGVYAYLAARDHAALVQGGLGSSNDKIAEAIEVIRAEWARMAEEGMSATELAQVKTYLTGAYPLRFDGNGRIAAILTSMQLDGLGPEYITTRNARIEAVTPEDVRRVARDLLRADDLRFVVVGRPEGLAATN